MGDLFFQERRRCRRVRVGDSTFVCLTGPERRPWHILDISEGGLSFRYVPKLELETMEDLPELEIVTRDATFSLEKLPFKTVSDTGMDGTPGSHLQLRRRGVQFGDLTKLQTAQLDHFISHYSVGPA